MRVRIVTYNIHKGRGPDLRRRLGRISQVLRELDADVVALQEAFRHDEEHGIPCQTRELGEALGLPYVATGWNVPRRRGVYGNATLSRLPLSDSRNLSLKWRIKKERSALYTGVDTPAGPLHLFNVHLGLAHFERKIQMRWVREHADAFAEAHAPVVIVGDTNDWGNRLHRQTLQESGFACATGTETGRPARTYPSYLPLGALDRVYVRGKIRLLGSRPARTPLTRTASDHLPVVVDMELNS